MNLSEKLGIVSVSIRNESIFLAGIFYTGRLRVDQVF